MCFSLRFSLFLLDYADNIITLLMPGPPVLIFISRLLMCRISLLPPPMLMMISCRSRFRITPVGEAGLILREGSQDADYVDFSDCRRGLMMWILILMPPPAQAIIFRMLIFLADFFSFSIDFRSRFRAD